MNFKNVLISVSDKSDLDLLVQHLAKSGARIVSTGGTSQFIKKLGISVVEVSEQTGFPEVMDGRVRTLHPKIHVPLLARRDNPEDQKLLKEMSLQSFDLVICNLYPFENALKDGEVGSELIEYIDIGGPTLLRAAAKNYASIVVVCDPKDYKYLIEKQELNESDRKNLAGKVFRHVSSYDAMVADVLCEPTSIEKEFSVGGSLVQTLRYGENPQQSASWFKTKSAAGGLHEAQIIQGKELSYNNLLDLDAAASTVRLFQSPVAVAVKHNNPCGVGQSTDIESAVAKAIKADPVSVFGGIVAVNGKVDLKTAQLLNSLFLECVIAPEYSDEALAAFEKKKNLRILCWKDLRAKSLQASPTLKKSFKSIEGGVLVQSFDAVEPWSSEWEVIGEQPDAKRRSDIEFTWRVVARLKSNAISIGKDLQTLGLGMGQVNRVDAVRQAVERWQEHHKDVTDPVLCSDAFFPFPDSIEAAHKNGIRWVVQPGGSIKDGEVVARAKELGVNLVLTRRRHFLH